MSAITIRPEGRDALYEQIIVGLGGIGDVWTAIEKEDYEAATRLGRAFSDDLRLVLDDLGWGEGAGGAVRLRTPADVLGRVMHRHSEIAASQGPTNEKQRAEAEEAEEQDRLVIETCETVLASLQGEGHR